MDTTGPMTVSRRPDIWGLSISIALLALSAFVVWQATGMRIGTFQRPGSGAAPLAIGLTLAALSIVLIVDAMKGPPTEIDFSIRAFAPVIAGMLVWPMILPAFGMVPATIALICVSSLAFRPVRPVATLVLSVCVAALGTLIFVMGLGLPIRLFIW